MILPTWAMIGLYFIVSWAFWIGLWSIAGTLRAPFAAMGLAAHAVEYGIKK